MRIPRFRVYRAFEELDHLDNYSCEGLVRKAEINHTGLVVTVPRFAAACSLLIWPAGWITAAALTGPWAWLAVVGGPVTHSALLIVSDAAAACVVFLLARDACLYFGLRRELRRTCCPRCSQPLVGLPIRAAGDDNDPAKRFVICTECGKRHMLLELGLTPLDLTPYEVRGVAPNPAARRPMRP